MANFRLLQKQQRLLTLNTDENIAEFHCFERIKSLKAPEAIGNPSMTWQGQEGFV